ncbi:MAG: hypothetical protein HRT53_05955 [Colwellia sp.]|nr:hypothetical protein [Colwellia sp.]
MIDSTYSSNDKNLKWAGIIIAASTLLSLFMMMHHPTVTTTGMAAQVAEVQHESLVNNIVHGSLILFVLMTLAAFSIYSNHRGKKHLAVAIAHLFYFVGSLAMVAAALINGYVYPDFLLEYRTASAQELAQLPMFKSLLWSTNQTLAKLGVITMSVAILFWSIDLLRDKGIVKIVAVLGMIIGLGCSVAIIVGVLTLNVAGMTQIVMLQGLWNLAIAYLMIRSK